jgi:hypothetical protein
MAPARNELTHYRRPAWWCYPERCENGHEWGPGLVLVSFTRCGCPPVRAAYGETGGLGHLTVACRAPGCTTTWYTPPHEPVRAKAVRTGSDRDAWHPAW